jgi:hypothetical protein
MFLSVGFPRGARNSVRQTRKDNVKRQPLFRIYPILFFAFAMSTRVSMY